MTPQTRGERLADRHLTVVSFTAMKDQTISRPPASPSAAPDVADWPVDVQRMDASGEVDLGQLEFNLSLTPLERIEQNDAWVRFIQSARCAGQALYAKQSPP
jgi:hypothetical protein